MIDYYYLIAQLPMLFFGQKSWMTRDLFLSEARKWFSPDQYCRLEQVSLDDYHVQKSDQSIVAAYKDFEYTLRMEIAQMRKAANEDKESIPSLFPVSLIKDAHPLEAEKKLLQLRWQFIEEKEAGHDFDWTLLALYSLKLQILEKLAQFDKYKGERVFNELCEVSL